MRVIFIKDLKGQGKKDDIKEVKAGYAMNFLIKNGYALAATDDNVKSHESDLKKRDKEEQAKILFCENLKKILEQDEYRFKIKAGKEGKTFGTISTKAIHDELNKKGYDIDKKNIMIENSIDSVGTHIVNVNLHKKVPANTKIVVEV